MEQITRPMVIVYRVIFSWSARPGGRLQFLTLITLEISGAAGTGQLRWCRCKSFRHHRYIQSLDLTLASHPSASGRCQSSFQNSDLSSLWELGIGFPLILLNIISGTLGMNDISDWFPKSKSKPRALRITRHGQQHSRRRPHLQITSARLMPTKEQPPLDLSNNVERTRLTSLRRYWRMSSNG